MQRLIVRSLLAVSLLGALLCLPGIASADGTGPVVWTLSGVSFEQIDQTTGLPAVPTVTGGGVTTGSSFAFDGTTFSAFNVTTTAGAGFGGATYTALGPFTSNNNTLWLTNSSGDLLALFFVNPLVNLGGTVSDPLITGFDFGGEEGTLTGTFGARFITGGEATSTVSVVTPEPSSLSLLGVGLGALLAFAAIRKAV